MADVLIRPTEPGDAQLLYANLRVSDREEVLAAGRTDILGAIEQGVKSSTLCWTGFIDGQLAAILGVAPINLLGGVGSPWMLGTPVLDAHSRVLVRTTPPYIAEMRQAFPVLFNFVYANNTTSVRWLKRLGFVVHPPQPYGPHGAPFHYFEMRL